MFGTTNHVDVVGAFFGALGFVDAVPERGLYRLKQQDALLGFKVLDTVLDFFPESVGSVQFFVVELEEAFVVLDGFNGFIS